MSDSLENIADTQNNVTQPESFVVKESEETSTPHVGDGEAEFYVEAEGDQSKEPNSASPSESELHARWLKEREKRKKKEEQRKAEAERADRLEARLAELEKGVTSVTRGPRPDPFDFESKEAFYEADAEWHRKGTVTNEPSKPETVSNKSAFSDEDEFYLYQKEQDVSSVIPDYEAQKQRLIEQFAQYGGGEDNITHLASIARQSGHNIAKAIIGLNNNPSMIRRLNEAYAKGSPFALADILDEAQKKVTIHERKPLDTKPEPTISNGGRVDNLQAAVEKAKEAWMKDSSIANYKAYKAAQKAAKTK